MDFKKEEQLCEPIKKFLKKKKFYQLYPEIDFYKHRIDILGYSKITGETVAVELKLKKWKKALQQALVYQLCSDYVYIAMPKASLHQSAISKIESFGIGIVAIHSSKRCETISKPSKSHLVKDRYRYKFIETVFLEQIK